MSIQCTAFSLNHHLDMDPELGACLFHRRWRELGKYLVDGSDQAGFSVVGGHVGDVLDVWTNEVVQQVQVRGGGGPVREGYKVVAFLLKPSLGFFGLVGRRRVLLPHPGSATGHLIAPGDHHTLQHIQVHFGVDFKDVRWHDVALTWNHTKAGNFVFITLGTSLLFVAIQRGYWQWSCCHNLDW